jgi:DNA-binding transcriptional LysR family regulator
VISENLVAAVPPGHPLAARSAVCLAELAEFPVVSMSAGTGVRAVYDQACAAAGLRPSIAFQASAPSAVADLAGRGLGVAIFSATMATFYTDRLIAVPVTGVATPSLLALIWKTAPSRALRELVACACAAFGMPEARPEMERASVIN